LKQHVVIGNFRLSYYKKFKDFYDKLTEELVFSKLEQNLVSNKLVAPLHQKFIFGSVHEVDKFLVESCKAFAPNSSGELMLQWVHFLDSFVYFKRYL